MFLFSSQEVTCSLSIFLSLPQVNRLKKQRPVFFNENLSESAPKKKGYKKSRSKRTAEKV